METSEHLEFYLHDKKHSLRASDVPPSMSLLDYLRDVMQFKGTKAMCREGGCGACVVAVTFKHTNTGKEVTLAVNSCLVNVFSCSGWKISTVEGIGSSVQGYHEIQTSLADNNGTQCGFCSPGMVMNMFALQKSGKYSKADIENSFGGNLCRCTGYRPILDSLRKVASDKDENGFEMLPDIEDVRICAKNSECQKSCVTPCSLYDVTLAYSSEEVEWYKLYSIKEILTIFRNNPNTRCQLVAGNTAQGVYHKEFSGAQINMDINSVVELKTTEHNTNEVVLGGNVTLTDAMDFFSEVSKNDSDFMYLEQFRKHIDLVAHVPVRNIGTLAGNLMIKHTKNEFPSDIYLLLATVDAKLCIVDTNGRETTENMVAFLGHDMNKKVIKYVKLPKLASTTIFDSYKIMPRAQNAHAIVNAGFLMNVVKDKVTTARIVYGNINETFVRAKKAEAALIGKNPYSESTMQGVFKALDQELVPDHKLPDPMPDFRKKLAIALFYKFILSVTPNLKPELKSGGQKLIRNGLSEGTQKYVPDESMFPIGKPVHKIEALAQTSGEAQYIPDIPELPGQLHGVFVLAKKPAGTIIKSQDASAAKNMQGVVEYFNAADIDISKGQFNLILPVIPGVFDDYDPLFATEKVLYYNQPVGVIVAKTRAVAEKAARLVVINYTENRLVKPVIRLRDAMKDPKRVTFKGEQQPTSNGTNIVHTINGKFDISWQYHFHMETQCCLVVPLENNEYDVYSTTQWMDMTQLACKLVTGIPLNKINLKVRRLGGAYGGKISRNNYAACAALLASKKLKKPVRIWMSLMDNMDAIGKRNPMAADYTVQTDAEGVVQKLKLRAYSDVGISGNEYPGGMIMNTVKDTYNVAPLDFKMYTVKTDNPAATWTRSPGSAEGIAVMEAIQEHISYELKMDPLVVRNKNLQAEKQLKDMLKDMDSFADLPARKATVEKFNKANRWRKRGLSVVPMVYLLGLEGNFNVMVTIYGNDGTVSISHGGIEMGQGINTKAVQVVAKTLDIDMEKISVQPSSTFANPNTFVSGGSITSESVCMGLQTCCKELLDLMSPYKKPVWEDWVTEANANGVNLCNTYTRKNSAAGNYKIYGVLAAEVEFDVLTGNHEVLRVDISEDTGDSMSPIIDMGQVEGAYMMGMGYWTSEDIVFADNGELMTNRTWTYKPPGVKDIPLEFNVKFPAGHPNELSPFKSKATGEPPLCLSVGTALAIKQAIKAARTDISADDGAKWLAIDGPCKVEQNFMSCDPRYTQYKLT